MPRTLFAMMAIAAGLAALAVPGASARANVTVYTDQALFESQLASSYLETFDSLPVNTALPSPQAFSGNGFAFSAATVGPVGTSGFFNIDSGGGDVWLSTNTAGLTIRFTMTGLTPVTAIGGYFFVTNEPGQVVVGSLTVGLADGTTQLLNNPSPLAFLGFTSDTAIAWLEITPLAGGNLQQPIWATVNNLIVGEVVPEPSALALGLIGLGAMAGVTRWRRIRAAHAA